MVSSRQPSWLRKSWNKTKCAEVIGEAIGLPYTEKPIAEVTEPVKELTIQDFVQKPVPVEELQSPFRIVICCVKIPLHRCIGLDDLIIKAPDALTGSLLCRHAFARTLNPRIEVIGCTVPHSDKLEQTEHALAEANAKLDQMEETFHRRGNVIKILESERDGLERELKEAAAGAAQGCSRMDGPRE